MPTSNILSESFDYFCREEIKLEIVTIRIAVVGYYLSDVQDPKKGMVFSNTAQYHISRSNNEHIKGRLTNERLWNMLFSANRNGLFDQYQEIKSRPPEGTFDHARLPENSAKVQYHALMAVLRIRIPWIRIRIQHFKWIRIQGFDDQTLK